MRNLNPGKKSTSIKTNKDDFKLMAELDSAITAAIAAYVREHRARFIDAKAEPEDVILNVLIKILCDTFVTCVSVGHGDIHQSKEKFLLVLACEIDNYYANPNKECH